MSRPNGVFKQRNSYQEELTATFYAQCPKAVFAAMAVSYASRQVNEDFAHVEAELLNEWQVLYDNGIVPQKPPRI
jgi:hypothetical protein